MSFSFDPLTLIGWVCLLFAFLVFLGSLIGTFRASREATLFGIPGLGGVIGGIVGSIIPGLGTAVGADVGGLFDGSWNGNSGAMPPYPTHWSGNASGSVGGVDFEVTHTKRDDTMQWVALGAAGLAALVILKK